MSTSTNRFNILILDDSDIDRLVIAKTLQALGIADFNTFDCPVECLNYLGTIAEKDWPSHIFIDLNMPTLNGYQFIDEYLKIQNTIHSTSEIYILSSSNNHADILKSQENRAIKDYLIKPITLDKASLLLGKTEKDN